MKLTYLTLTDITDYEMTTHWLYKYKKRWPNWATKIFNKYIVNKAFKKWVRYIESHSSDMTNGKSRT